jgi:hypothetical protein
VAVRIDMNYEKCTIELTTSCVVVKENKSKMELKNPQRKPLKKIQVDGCLIDDERERCDWIITCDDPELKAIYIELKGCNINKAISQLQSTIAHTKEKYSNHNKECYAITTRFPKHDSTTRQYTIEMMKQYNAKLFIKNLLISVNI